MDDHVVQSLRNARGDMLKVPGSVCVCVCLLLTLCKQLGDGFAVVLCAVTLFSSKLLIGCLHALCKTTIHNKHMLRVETNTHK